MEFIKNALWVLMCVVITSALGYGVYWVARSLSYAIFYEDVVRETIQEMVKPEALK